ncbi:unnamed protein product [marine sediment metagenome]|uniref:Uncharacterized protein n=1 Tax=marine sediment metagenome TaxID=412755 RepID=X1JVL2_9ZZZZ
MKKDVPNKKNGVKATNGNVLASCAEAIALRKYQAAITSITEATIIE